MVRILLADDHPLIRAGLRTTLEQEENLIVIGEAIDGVQTINLCRELTPDILLLDLSMPGPSPATTVRRITDECPEIKIIILSAFDDEVYVRNLIGLGITGYILKDEAPESLIRAIRVSLEGGAWFSRRIIDILAKPSVEVGYPEVNNHLTDRENEVLHLMAKGLANSQIADTLAIAEGTVKNHLVNIYQKLGVHSRAEAVAWVWQNEKAH